MSFSGERYSKQSPLYPPMSLVELEAIGRRIFPGRRWRAPLARAIGMEQRQLYRYFDGEWPIPATVAVTLRLLDNAWRMGPVVWEAARQRLVTTEGGGANDIELPDILADGSVPNRDSGEPGS